MTISSPTVCLSRMPNPGLMMYKSSMPRRWSMMMLKLRETSVVWQPQDLIQDASGLDRSFEHGLIRAALQNFDVSMVPIFFVLIWRWAIYDSRSSSHSLWKNEEATLMRWKFSLCLLVSVITCLWFFVLALWCYSTSVNCRLHYKAGHVSCFLGEHH